jgi:hypothetical protein
MTVVRISPGRFDASNYRIVRTLLDESQASLKPAISGLNGNLAYYIGIDRENNTMTNVSVWASLDDAMQMASLPAMLALARTFVEMGVRFETPITNHETLWSSSRVPAEAHRVAIQKPRSDAKRKFISSLVLASAATQPLRLEAAGDASIVVSEAPADHQSVARDEPKDGRGVQRIAIG